MHFQILYEFPRKCISKIVQSSFQAVFEYFMLLFALDMVRSDVFLKPIVSTDPNVLM